MQKWERRSHLELSGDGKEIAQHGTASFPMRLYYVDVGFFTGGRAAWHWHDECEFVTVFSGSMELEVAGDTVVLAKNDSAFVNSGQVHAVSIRGDGTCRMISIVFSARILSGTPGSVFESKYVRPVIHHAAARIPVFRAESPEQAQILGIVRRIEEWNASQDFNRELELRSCLSSLWLHICSRFGESSGRQKASELYVKDLLTFVHDHYAEQISLDDLAAGAGISVRTCCRSFREQLKTTPFAYLQQYRINRAAALLLETSRPIVEIAMETGFAKLGREGPHFKRRRR